MSADSIQILDIEGKITCEASNLAVCSLSLNRRAPLSTCNSSTTAIATLLGERSSTIRLVGSRFCGAIICSDGKDSCLHSKVWICLFMCCITRAVHFDLVLNMMSQSFIQCLKRFVTKHGLPHQMVGVRQWQNVQGSCQISEENCRTSRGMAALGQIESTVKLVNN